MKIALSSIPVVILAGGDCISLMNNEPNIPKTMVLINNKPLLGWLLDHYMNYGFKSFIICAGKGKTKIDKYIQEYSKSADIDIKVVDTGDKNKTGSRLAQITKMVETDNYFALTYGDTYSQICLQDVFDSHIKSNKLVTLSAVHNPTRFRILGLLDTDSLVRGFSNKPVLERDYINGGFYFLKKDVFLLETLSCNINCVFENEVLEEIVNNKQLNAYRHDGYWQPVDSYRDVANLEKLLK